MLNAPGRGRSRGSAPPLSAVLSLLAAAPSDSWVRLNADKNTLSSVFPPNDLRALYGGSPAPAEPIQACWPSIGWDSNRHQLVLWGGGHANTSANEVYTWRCEDRNWQLAFLPSEMVGTGGAEYRSVDQTTPVSSHTYGNNNFLPLIDRFITLGGAAYNSGQLFKIYDETTNAALRYAGAYTLDLALAGTGKVGGITGSNNKRGAYVGVNIEGANAWELRDWYSGGQSAGIVGAARTDNGTAYLQHNGHDALLVTAGNRNVWLVEFPSNDWHDDIAYRVGGQGAWSGQGQGQMAYSPAHQVLMSTTDGANAAMVEFLDLKRTWSEWNGWRSITLAAGAARDEFVALNIRWCGVVFNPIKGCFTIWNMGSQVWEIYPPATVGGVTPDVGWTVVKPTMDTSGTQPRSNYITSGVNGETGIIGKFRWAPDLNAAVTTFGNQAGEVWAYKPAGWTYPEAI